MARQYGPYMEHVPLARRATMRYTKQIRRYWAQRKAGLNPVLPVDAFRRAGYRLPTYERKSSYRIPYAERAKRAPRKNKSRKISWPNPMTSRWLPAFKKALKTRVGWRKVTNVVEGDMHGVMSGGPSASSMARTNDYASDDKFEGWVLNGLGSKSGLQKFYNAVKQLGGKVEFSTKSQKRLSALERRGPVERMGDRDRRTIFALRTVLHGSAYAEGGTVPEEDDDHQDYYDWLASQIRSGGITLRPNDADARRRLLRAGYLDDGHRLSDLSL